MNPEEDGKKILTKNHQLIKYLIAGGFGGICATLCGHPLDTLKVRMQAKPMEYTNAWSTLTKIIHTEGPTGLYKGVMPPLLGVIPMFGLSFLSFGLGKNFFTNSIQKNDAELKPYQIILAGMFSGLATIPLSVPGERIKCLLQMQTGKMKKYSGFVDCAIKLYREGGIKNFYVGTCVTILRDVPAGGAYFGAYDLTMKYISYHYAETMMWKPIIAGGFAGMANWIVAMPADVLKSRLQISSMDKYPHGIRSLLPIILREEGARTLYRGVIPIMMRAIPANASCFLGIEIAMKFIEFYIPWL
ncbi:hypothetical protein PV326_002223 [Microctonus aethiopoides]|nr:hypothetical protein PV326_002223 [Microctonus aethiopoides]